MLKLIICILQYYAFMGNFDINFRFAIDSRLIALCKIVVFLLLK